FLATLLQLRRSFVGMEVEEKWVNFFCMIIDLNAELKNNKKMENMYEDLELKAYKALWKIASAPQPFVVKGLKICSLHWVVKWIDGEVEAFDELAGDAAKENLKKVLTLVLLQWTSCEDDNEDLKEALATLDNIVLQICTDHYTIYIIVCCLIAITGCDPKITSYLKRPCCLL
ncbi:hypothetical protein ACJX0J_022424, partial [Zea mays]